MTIFFTSDTHFYHKNILKYNAHSRQGNTVDEMNELLIENWNKDVGNNDVVYHLGDFSFGNKTKTRAILERLNGQIHFIEGNHDHAAYKNRDLFTSYQKYKEIKLDDCMIVLFHFPIEWWHRKEYGAIHLHGHMHCTCDTVRGTSGQVMDRRMDVGVDCRTDMRLWTWDEVKHQLDLA